MKNKGARILGKMIGNVLRLGLWLRTTQKQISQKKSRKDRRATKNLHDEGTGLGTKIPKKRGNHNLQELVGTRVGTMLKYNHKGTHAKKEEGVPSHE